MRLKPNRPSIAAPGQLVSIILKKLGYKEAPSCGCKAFSAKMNGWGWKGCFRLEPKGHRDEIVAWFCAKAREVGHEIDHDGAVQLLKAAVKSLARPPKRVRL